MYIALYQNVTREIRQNCGRVAKDVLVELANYTNPLGICWPGVERLASDTGYSAETVQSGLQKLLEHDYIRIHERYSSVRQRWEFEAYQVSPEVLCIREELHSQALRSYDYCNTRNSFVSKDSQPTTEPTTENHLQKPTTENHHQQQKDSLNVKNLESDTLTTAQTQPATPPEKQNQKKHKPTAAPAGATKTTKINYAPWSVELPTETDESAAVHVWSVAGGSMPMAVARYLVATRGPKVCYAAVRNYEKNASEIINPGGYIRSLIERSQVDPAYDDTPAAPAEPWPDDWSQVAG